jgi:hypothetical protein
VDEDRADLGHDSPVQVATKSKSLVLEKNGRLRGVYMSVFDFKNVSNVKHLLTNIPFKRFLNSSKPRWVW